MAEVWQYIMTNAWVHNTFLVVYAATIFLILGIVLAENRNPVKSLAWITVLLLLPVVGIILYIFFGRNIRNTRMISRRRRLKMVARRWWWSAGSICPARRWSSPTCAPR